MRFTFRDRQTLAFHLRTAAEVYRTDAVKISTGPQVGTTQTLIDQFLRQADECEKWADQLEAMRGE